MRSSQRNTRSALVLRPAIISGFTINEIAVVYGFAYSRVLRFPLLLCACENLTYFWCFIISFARIPRNAFLQEAEENAKFKNYE